MVKRRLKRGNSLMHVDSEEAGLITTRAEVVFFGVNTPPHLLRPTNDLKSKDLKTSSSSVYSCQIIPLSVSVSHRRRRVDAQDKKRFKRGANGAAVVRINRHW